MADLILTKQTSLSGEEVITRSMQFFSTAKWRATTQSARAATFAGRPPIPWLMVALTVLGFAFCLIPGIVMYVLVIRKLIRLQNLIVTATPVAGGSEVTVSCPTHSKKLATGFLEALPPLP